MLKNIYTYEATLICKQKHIQYTYEATWISCAHRDVNIYELSVSQQCTVGRAYGIGNGF